MKKILITTLSLLILTLAACGSASNEPQADSAQTNGPLPEATQLILGTFKLEGTENAITSEQAVELVTLWQVYQSLNESDVASQEESDALIEQIQETMTPEQMQAITDMELTQEDVFSIMQEQGITMGGAPQGNTGNGNGNEGSFTPPDGGVPGGGSPPDGGVPGGGFPAGGGDPGGNGGQGLSPDQIATAQAERGSGGGGPRGVPSPLIEALIQFLEKKTGS